MTRALLVSGVVIFLQISAVFGTVDSSRTIVYQLRSFIESPSTEGRYKVDEERLYSSKVLPRFYSSNLYNPAWTQFGHLSPQARLFVKYLENIDEHGLQSTDYHLALILHHRSQLGPYNTNLLQHIVKLDILLTDAFLLLSAHLNLGKVDSEKIKAEWNIQRDAPEMMLDEKLKEHLKKNTLIDFLNMLPGQNNHYESLKKQLKYFKTLAKKAWPAIKFKSTIHPTDTNEAIVDIRKRLRLLNFSVIDTVSPIYDESLQKVIRKFQKQHGLNDDGSLGKLTMDALNLTPKSRINQLIVNLERLRWMPLKMPSKRIEVNIADYRMLVIDGRDTVISSKAIVGKSYRKTPVFNSVMTYLVVCPTWVVPPTILANDVLPELKKGQDYLLKKNMSIISYSGQVVPYSAINWNSINAASFPYMIRQSSGPDNALGNIKFMFPNEYNVYIHDTPARELFEKDKRSFSSGCIRIQQPIELALYLLADKPEWNKEQLLSTIALNRERIIKLKEGIPVYVTYFTAWSMSANNFHFRTDLYERDATLLKALKEKPAFK